MSQSGGCGRRLNRDARARITAAMTNAPACKPNINARGRRQRRIVGTISAALCTFLWISFVRSGAPGIVRLSLFFPAAMTAVTLLQVRRNTCVAHAASGRREGDRGLEDAPADEVAASRRVARTIYRDGTLIGLGVAALAWLSALVG